MACKLCKGVELQVTEKSAGGAVVSAEVWVVGSVWVGLTHFRLVQGCGGYKNAPLCLQVVHVFTVNTA